MDHTHHHVPDAKADEQLKDPVCGMVVKSSSPHHHAYHGQHFYFCNPKCGIPYLKSGRKVTPTK